MKPLACTAAAAALAIAHASATQAPRRQTPPQRPSPQAPLFEARVDLVAVDVAVTRGGMPVPGLEATDFVVLDDGVEQKVESAVRDEEVPLDVQLVLDTSGSLSDARLRRLVDAATTLVGALRDGDRVGLVTFSEIVRVRSAPTNDFPLVLRTLAGLRGSGQSAVRDAIETGLSLRTAANARPLLIVFTDGIDNASWLTDEEVAASARQSGMVIHVVRAPGDNDRPPPLLETLTAASGGRIFRARSDDDYERLFASALREMRARYLLTFAPATPQKAGWHALTVRLRTGRAEIVARPGYSVLK